MQRNLHEGTFRLAPLITRSSCPSKPVVVPIPTPLSRMMNGRGAQGRGIADDGRWGWRPPRPGSESARPGPCDVELGVRVCAHTVTGQAARGRKEQLRESGCARRRRALASLSSCTITVCYVCTNVRASYSVVGFIARGTKKGKSLDTPLCGECVGENPAFLLFLVPRACNQSPYVLGQGLPVWVRAGRPAPARTV